MNTQAPNKEEHSGNSIEGLLLVIGSLALLVWTCFVVGQLVSPDFRKAVRSIYTPATATAVPTATEQPIIEPPIKSCDFMTTLNTFNFSGLPAGQSIEIWIDTDTTSRKYRLECIDPGGNYLPEAKITALDGKPFDDSWYWLIIPNCTIECVADPQETP